MKHPTIPPGWRLLGPEERIERGDMCYCHRKLTLKSWLPVVSCFGEWTHSYPSFTFIRRQKQPDKEKQMKPTPLKEPITVEFDCVERAIVMALICTEIHPWLSKNPRMKRFYESYSRGPVNNQIFAQLERKLNYQGININTWEPPDRLLVGEHEVKFVEGGIKVGCTFVDDNTVLKIAEKLSKK